MANLLAKFRIDFHDVVMIPDIAKKASDPIKDEFKTILTQANISDEEVLSNLEKTNRHLRLAELLREHSSDSETVVMTLPIPRKSSHSNQLWMAWLEIMSRNMPPMLFVRGNQTSVLTFYS
eukprot:maker-scaffold2421_size15883-snap-gene-0.1 protein:Tk06531 transcript:maker-scaffold2421_size15883-snap-gene-0.1-mRNA-1 annotation:"af190129_1na+ k+ 2cl- cotransporter"